MRVLITGAGGFVGPYLITALRRACANNIDIIATSKVGGEHPVLGRILELDITDRAAVNWCISETRPSHVINLAGLAAPAAASADPDLAWRVHVYAALNLAHAILNQARDCWFINVGSGLVYGDSAGAGQPLSEAALLVPTSEYAVTKAAADLALGALAHRGLKCIRMRPFNHAGPGQTEEFVIPAFALQLARIEAGLAPPVVRVGNLEAQRDFLDVRDVAEAYVLSVQRASEIGSGNIINIASGVPCRISEVLRRLIAMCRVEISIEDEASRMRPNDLACIVGDASLARRLLGWSPRHTLDETLATVLDDARARIAR